VTVPQLCCNRSVHVPVSTSIQPLGTMKYVFPVSLLLLIAFVAPVRAAHQDTIKRSFDVGANGTLRLDLDRGDVTIEASDDARVHVVMVRDVEGATDEQLKTIFEYHEYRMDQRANDVIVESRFDGDDRTEWAWRNWKKTNRFRLHVTVLVPTDYAVDFETAAGEVYIEDVTGRVVGRTGAGSVDILRVVGSVSLDTGAGNVHLDDVSGSVDASTGAGNLTLERIAGSIRASTGAGDITAYILEQPRDDSRFETGAGDVTVYVAGDLGFDIDAQASVGSVSCDFGLRVRGKWMSKSCAGDINGGGPGLALSSGVGNVALHRR